MLLIGKASDVLRHYIKGRQIKTHLSFVFAKSSSFSPFEGKTEGVIRAKWLRSMGRSEFSGRIPPAGLVFQFDVSRKEKLRAPMFAPGGTKGKGAASAFAVRR